MRFVEHHPALYAIPAVLPAVVVVAVIVMLDSLVAAGTLAQVMGLGDGGVLSGAPPLVLTSWKPL